ncbi:hypothetical protein MRX96_018232 [Rhipicephalus microplus]
MLDAAQDAEKRCVQRTERRRVQRTSFDGAVPSLSPTYYAKERATAPKASAMGSTSQKKKKKKLARLCDSRSPPSGAEENCNAEARFYDEEAKPSES